MNPYYPPDLPFPLVRAWYEAFAERTSLPLFLFNTPYSGTALTVDQIVELAEIDIVCGIKNPRGREHLLELQDADRRPDRRRRRGRARLAEPAHRITASRR